MVTHEFHAPVAPLFVPGDRPDRFAKAAQSGADAVILDLEDAVAPENKDEARSNVADHALRDLPVIVRINGSATDWFKADLAALSGVPLAAIMLPKAESAADLAAVQIGLGRAVPIIPLIETARGLVNLSEILSGQGAKVAAFGSLDFALDLGYIPAWDNLIAARSELALRSRAFGLPAPIDGVTPCIDDIALIETEARRASSLGFGGKLAIHPRQIAPIRTAFEPSDDQIMWAKRVIACEQSGVAKIDGMMIDRPVLLKARQVLAYGKRSGE
jgi:citrate lyase subunit beta/citryl-CoA lyase